MNLFFKRVLLTSLVAGTLDILTAYTLFFIRNHRMSKKMFQYIAGGALGLDNTINGGWPVILLGAFFHYFIVFSFTLFFFLLYRKSRLSVVNLYVVGLVYGIFIWTVMTLVVVPLSRLPKAPIDAGRAVVDAVLLGVMIGLPLVFSARAYFSGRRGIFSSN